MKKHQVNQYTIILVNYQRCYKIINKIIQMLTFSSLKKSEMKASKSSSQSREREEKLNDRYNISRGKIKTKTKEARTDGYGKQNMTTNRKAHICFTFADESLQNLIEREKSQLRINRQSTTANSSQMVYMPSESLGRKSMTMTLKRKLNPVQCQHKHIEKLKKEIQMKQNQYKEIIHQAASLIDKSIVSACQQFESFIKTLERIKREWVDELQNCKLSYLENLVDNQLQTWSKKLGLILNCYDKIESDNNPNWLKYCSEADKIEQEFKKYLETKNTKILKIEEIVNISNSIDCSQILTILKKQILKTSVDLQESPVAFAEEDSMKSSLFEFIDLLKSKN